MNAANRQYTRWLTLLGTIITQFALGSVYTWSLFNSSLSAKLDETGKPGGVFIRPVKPRPGALFIRGR
ncbi:resistance protein [Klebsiella michiganensis]|uniref:Resistance protein n=1 Tax=Klebsiella michiganensis TaxID=1134687 RepID=A0A7H4PFR2_9ENTR|nr:resistance protein [Klebsiella michiganensis]